MGGGDHYYFFNAVTTVDVLTARDSIRSERINKVDRDFSHWLILSFVCPCKDGGYRD